MKAYPIGWLAAATLTPLLVSSNAAASAMGFSDLNISGSVALSTSIGIAPFSDGEVTQNGQISTILSGTTTNSPFSTTPGTADGSNDATTMLPTTNPLTGALTASGDGVGYSTVLRAMNPTGFDFNEGYDFITEFGIDMENTSLLNTYTVTFELDYNHRVHATGDDAYAESKLDLEENGIDIFGSDIVSDTLLDGPMAPPQDAIGIYLFDVIVAANSTVTLAGVHQWEGGVFEPGMSDVDILIDLTLVDVTCQGQDCTMRPVPEPGMAGLIASALTGIAWLRRRRLPGATA